MRSFSTTTVPSSDVTAFVPYYSLSETKLMGRGEPKPVSFVWVAGNFFPTLGIQPELGRQFTPEESVRGGRKAVLLSYPFWQRQFAGNPAIVGQAFSSTMIPSPSSACFPQHSTSARFSRRERK